MAEQAREQAGEHAAHGEGDGHHHTNYIKIWGILVVLLVISVAGPFAGIRVVTLLTAFGIAVVKAYLVAKHFMHLDIERRYVIYILVSMLAFMFLLFAGVAPDVLHHSGHQWENVAAQAEVNRVMHGGAEGAEAPPFTAEGEFRNTCALCHGQAGDGQGPAASGLAVPPANFTDPAFWATRDRDRIVQVITNGAVSVGGSPLMLAFGARYTPEQIEALTDYVIGLRPEGAGPPEQGAAEDADASLEADAGAAEAAEGEENSAPEEETEGSTTEENSAPEEEAEE